MNKYEVLFEKPYAALKEAVRKHIRIEDAVLDIGCGEGSLFDIVNGCTLHGVDIDHDALEKLKKKFPHATIYEQDANHFLASTPLRGIDAIVVNATLHEINTPRSQAAYLDGFFAQSRRILHPGGCLIIGDYYYPPELSREEVDAFIEYQRKSIGHADAREKFINPALIEKKAKEHGFSILEQEDIRAVREIDRRYYLYVLKKE